MFFFRITIHKIFYDFNIIYYLLSKHILLNTLVIFLLFSYLAIFFPEYSYNRLSSGIDHVKHIKW